MTSPEVHVAIVAELEERSIAKTAAELEKSFNQYNVPIGADIKAAEIKAASARLHKEFGEIRTELKLDVDRAGFAQASRAIRSTTNEAKSLHSVIEDIGKTAFRTSRGLMTFGAPVVVKGLLDFVQVATQATQSLWLLPAAATAAAAGVGTLALATSGFADTIKEVRDPEKFAEAIQLLSPAASQAALSIRNLLPEFDALKNATQDAFFKGFGEQIDRLATTYLPTIQNLTTSIATSFNNMITNVADQLMTPDTQAAMQTTFANISQMFTNLEPVAGSLTRAFTDIAEVGSGFLPGLATEIANAATSFENFIAQARASGDLARWIQEGIDAVKNLGAAAIELVQIFYRVFGPDTSNNISGIHTGIQSLDDTIQSYNADMTKTSEIIGLVTLDTQTWATSWNEEMVAMQGPLGTLRDGILDIPEALAVVANKVIDVANIFNHAINKMAENAGHFLDPFLPGDQSKFNPIPDIPHVPTGGDWRGYTDTRGIPGGGGPGAQRERRGAPPLPGQTPMPGGPYPGPFAVPPPPPDKGTKVSDKDRLDAIKAGLDPSLYKVADPFAPIPGLPDPYAAPPGAVQGVADPQQVFEAQQRVVAEAHDLEEDRKNRLALERDNESTAEEIADARWKELQDATNLQKAQADLGDKMRGTAKDVKAGSDELSAALDPDLGLGRGLAGLADNLVRFMGHMALAGPMAQWQQTINQSEAATGITGGYGLLGIRGAENLGRGLSPLLGQPMPGVSAEGLYPSASSPTSMPSANVMPSILEDTGSVPSGPQSRQAASLIQQMFGSQLRGKIGGSRDTNTAKGTHDAGLSIDIPIGADQKALGDQIRDYLQANAAALGLKYTIWRDQGMYPGGGGFTTPGHQDHVDAHFNGTGGTGGPLTAGYNAGSTTTLPGGGSIPIPLPVTIVGMGAGGGGGGGMPGLPGGGGPTAGASPGTTGKDALASTIINQARAAGLNKEQTLAALAVANQESAMGSNPAAYREQTQNGTPGITGPFQQDTSYAKYGNRNDPTVAAKGFIDQFIHTGQGLNNPDAFAQALAVQRPAAAGQGGYNASTLRSGQYATALDYYNRLTGTPGVGPANRPPSPGKPGFIPGIGYVDSNGNPTGYNPGGGKPPGVPGAGEAGPFGQRTMPPLNGPGGGTLPVNPTQNGVPTGPDAFVPSLGGPGMGPTQIGSLAPPDSTNPGGEGFGIMPGGTISSAISGAADFGGFGGGAAAQTLMKLANRTIQYGGEMAGHAVEGLMQTFLPTGGSELAQNSWLTRIIGGISAAAPALPNVAGGALGQQQIQGPLAPTDVASGQGTGPAPGPPNINIVQNNHNGLTTAEQAANAVADHVRTANAGPMAGAGAPPR